MDSAQGRELINELKANRAMTAQCTRVLSRVLAIVGDTHGPIGQTLLNAVEELIKDLPGS